MSWCFTCSRWTPHPSGLCPRCRVELEMRRRRFWRIPWHPQHVDLLEDEEERRPRVEMPKEMEP